MYIIQSQISSIRLAFQTRRFSSSWASEASFLLAFPDPSDRPPVRLHILRVSSVTLSYLRPFLLFFTANIGKNLQICKGKSLLYEEKSLLNTTTVRILGFIEDSWHPLIQILLSATPDLNLTQHYLGGISCN